MVEQTRTIRFNTHSQTTRDGAYHEETYAGGIDHPRINWAREYQFDGGLPE